jgi:hypothetical protein
VKLAQTWLAGLIMLGAVYLAGTQGAGLAKAFGGAQKFVSGTEATAIGR